MSPELFLLKCTNSGKTGFSYARVVSAVFLLRAESVRGLGFESRTTHPPSFAVLSYDLGVFIPKVNLPKKISVMFPFGWRTHVTFEEHILANEHEFHSIPQDIRSFIFTLKNIFDNNS
jgi:hypothetical protein